MKIKLEYFRQIKDKNYIGGVCGGYNTIFILDHMYE